MLGCLKVMQEHHVTSSGTSVQQHDLPATSIVNSCQLYGQDSVAAHARLRGAPSCARIEMLAEVCQAQALACSGRCCQMISGLDESGVRSDVRKYSTHLSG